MDGSEIYLGLLSGSNTTVEQLHKEIIMVGYFKLIQNKPGLNFYICYLISTINFFEQPYFEIIPAFIVK